MNIIDKVEKLAIEAKEKDEYAIAGILQTILAENEHGTLTDFAQYVYIYVVLQKELELNKQALMN